MLIKLLILLGLTKLLDNGGKPITLALIYTAMMFILGLIQGGAIGLLVIYVPVTLVLSFVYFIILKRLESSIFFWIVAFIAGIAIGFV